MKYLEQLNEAYRTRVRLIEELRANPALVETDEAKVVIALTHHDWSYEYADDIDAYRNASSHEKKIRAMIDGLPEGEVKSLATKCIDGNGSDTTWETIATLKEMFPHNQVMSYIEHDPSGATGIALLKDVSDDVKSGLLDLFYLIEILVEMTHGIYRDRFLFNSKTPNTSQMRRIAMETEDAIYYGIATPKNITSVTEDIAALPNLMDLAWILNEHPNILNNLATVALTKDKYFPENTVFTLEMSYGGDVLFFVS